MNRKVDTIHVYLFQDEMMVSLVGDTEIGFRNSLNFSFDYIGGHPDWLRIFQFIKFFEPDHVFISERIVS